MVNPIGTAAPMVVKNGPEITPPLTDEFGQRNAVTAALTNGRFAVVWEEDGPFDGAQYGSLRVRLLNSDGTPASAEIRVSDPWNSQPADAKIAPMANGRFVVTWTVLNAVDGDGDASIRARVFNADGSPFGTELAVNTTKFNPQRWSSVDVLTNDRIVIAWEDFSFTGADTSGSAIRARVFNPDGTQAEPEFLVNTYTEGAQDDVNVVGLTDGRFVISWNDRSGLSPDGAGLKARTFDADGTVYADEFYASAINNRYVYNHHATAMSDGRFAVTFSENQDAGQVVVAQILNGNGTVSVPQFTVSDPADYSSTDARIAELEDGRFVIVWSDQSTDALQEGGRIRVRIFNADGSESIPGFVIETDSSTDQAEPSVAALEN